MFRNGDLQSGSNVLRQIDLGDLLIPGNDDELASTGDIQAKEKVNDSQYLGKVLQTSCSLDEQRKKALNKLAELQTLIVSTNSSDALLKQQSTLVMLLEYLRYWIAKVNRKFQSLYGNDQQMLYQINNSVLNQLRRRSHHQ